MDDWKIDEKESHAPIERNDCLEFQCTYSRYRTVMNEIIECNAWHGEQFSK